MSTLLLLAGLAVLQEETFESTPVEHWERVRSPRHPAYNETRIADGALRFRSLGRATAWRQTRAGAWPVDPERSYDFTAAVRLTGTHRNSAWIALEWRDASFERLREDRTPAAGTAGDRTELSLDIPRVPDEARWVSLRLEFDGPDFRGECVFDSLRLSGRPRLLLERPLSITVTGLPPGDHRLHVAVRDSMGRDAAPTMSLAVRPNRRMDLALPRLPPGFYRIEAAVAEARRSWPLSVPVPGPSVRGPVGGIFGPGTFRQAEALARQAGFGTAGVVVWGRPAGTAAEVEAVAKSLGRIEGVAVIGLLEAPPPELFDPDLDESLTEIFRLPPGVWTTPLAETLARHAGTISRWHASAASAPAPLLPALPEARPPSVADLLGRVAEGSPVFVRVDEMIDAEGHPLAPLHAVGVVNAALAGATRNRELSLSDPRLKDTVFEREGSLVVAAWSEEGDVERELALGGEVEIHPVLGTPRRLAPGERVRFGPQPVFLTGVEPVLLRLQRSARLHPSESIPLRVDPVTRAFRFRNPSREAPLRDVRFRVTGGTIRPVEGSMAEVPAGEEVSADVTFVLPPDAEPGEDLLAAEISFTLEGKTYGTRLSRAVRRVPELRIDVDVAEGVAAHSRTVAIRIHNASARPANLVARVRLPSMPEESVALGLVPAGSAGLRRLEYTVRDVHLLDPEARTGECRVEEIGGDRLHARRAIPLQ